MTELADTDPADLCGVHVLPEGNRKPEPLTLADLARLTADRTLRNVHIECRTWGTPAQRHWTVSGDTRKRRVSSVATNIETAIDSLCRCAEEDAA